MDKIIPKIKIQEIYKSNIVDKILPANIVFHTTTYKKINTSIITTIVNNIKKIIGSIQFLNIFSQFRNIFIKIKKIFKRIFKKIFKFVNKIISKIKTLIIKPFVKIFKTISKIIKISFNMLKKMLFKIINFTKKIFHFFKKIIQVSKFIISITFKIIYKGFKFIYDVIKLNIKLIKLLFRAHKFLGIFKSNKTLKFVNGKIHKSPPNAMEFFKELPKKVKNNIGQLFNKTPKANKSIKETIKTLTSSITNTVGDIIKWFSGLGKKLKNPTLRKLIWGGLKKILKKIGFKLATTAAASLLLASGIGSWAGLLILITKWIGGFAADMAIFNQGKATWRNMINAFLENMPYLDILFVLDHSANDLLGESLNIYQPAFKWIQNILNIKDNELDYDLLDKSSQTNVSNNINKDPNLIILNNIRNNETDNKQYNLLNIIDEIYNEQNYSLINVSNKYIEKICNLLNYRNNFISNLMV